MRPWVEPTVNQVMNTIQKRLLAHGFRLAGKIVLMLLGALVAVPVWGELRNARLWRQVCILTGFYVALFVYMLTALAWAFWWLLLRKLFPDANPWATLRGGTR